MAEVLRSVVAGSFFPGDPIELKQMVDEFLSEVTTKLPVPKAIISPHAGFIYSGPIAAAGYHALKQAATRYRRVIVMGPSHRYPIAGIALPQASAYQTPLGQIPIDQAAIQTLLKYEGVTLDNQPFYQPENALETQLPFLQTVLSKFKLVPILVGQIDPYQLAALLNLFWEDKETLFVISSDLSHYQEYNSARRQDLDTIDAIIHLEPNRINFDDACGRTGIQAVLRIAQERALKVNLIDYRNSGDTAGSKDQVVGYAAIHFYEE